MIKYAPQRWELKKKYNKIDVLGGCSHEVGTKMKELFRVKRAGEILMKVQKSVLSSSLNIAHCFKVIKFLYFSCLRNAKLTVSSKS